MTQMIRKDREITDRNEIIAILKRCNTIRIAFSGNEYPYIVPVSFGVKESDGNLFLYFHGAKKGYKIQLLEKSPKVGIEGDIFYKVEETRYGITARYESVIGFGTVEKADGKEIVEGLQAICAHYGKADFSISDCQSLPMTAVYKIKIEQLTGKQNLPKNSG